MAVALPNDTHDQSMDAEQTGQYRTRKASKSAWQVVSGRTSCLYLETRRILDSGDRESSWPFGGVD